MIYKAKLGRSEAGKVMRDIKPAFDADIPEEALKIIIAAKANWDPKIQRYFDRNDKAEVIAYCHSTHACIMAGKVSPSGNVMRGCTQGCEAMHAKFDQILEAEPNNPEFVARPGNSKSARPPRTGILRGSPQHRR